MSADRSAALPASDAAMPTAEAGGLDPLSLMPLPDPAASGFTIDQVWPRQAPGEAPKTKPDWLVGLTAKPLS